jgi:hypothetical protein
MKVYYLFFIFFLGIGSSVLGGERAPLEIENFENPRPSWSIWNPKTWPFLKRCCPRRNKLHVFRCPSATGGTGDAVTTTDNPLAQRADRVKKAAIHASISHGSMTEKPEVIDQDLKKLLDDILGSINRKIENPIAKASLFIVSLGQGYSVLVFINGVTFYLQPLLLNQTPVLEDATPDQNQKSYIFNWVWLAWTHAFILWPNFAGISKANEDFCLWISKKTVSFQDPKIKKQANLLNTALFLVGSAGALIDCTFYYALQKEWETEGRNGINVITYFFAYIAYTIKNSQPNIRKLILRDSSRKSHREIDLLINKLQWVVKDASYGQLVAMNKLLGGNSSHKIIDFLRHGEDFQTDVNYSPEQKEKDKKMRKYLSFGGKALGAVALFGALMAGNSIFSKEPEETKWVLSSLISLIYVPIVLKFEQAALMIHNVSTGHRLPKNNAEPLQTELSLFWSSFMIANGFFQAAMPFLQSIKGLGFNWDVDTESGQVEIVDGAPPLSKVIPPLVPFFISVASHFGIRLEQNTNIFRSFYHKIRRKFFGKRAADETSILRYKLLNDLESLRSIFVSLKEDTLTKLLTQIKAPA